MRRGESTIEGRMSQLGLEPLNTQNKTERCPKCFVSRVTVDKVTCTYSDNFTWRRIEAALGIDRGQCITRLPLLWAIFLHARLKRVAKRCITITAGGSDADSPTSIAFALVDVVSRLAPGGRPFICAPLASIKYGNHALSWQ